ncbi:hypothetical protein DUNSADRAFT_13757 [Dunaliella salina]|uniref:Uncharacterized protein n=1 Tax=Dunaliella salina TaxID=3046 RepID=A0ABQ7G8R5_DUNSA|nr:hypothetical protein DUNSADRAFT_13757 [Dunaliella salina]|eukprot:KAF5831001.1 hypothetical protein DUNSADRAFT_13757 [Dunaliella salina]
MPRISARGNSLSSTKNRQGAWCVQWEPTSMTWNCNTWELKCVPHLPSIISGHLAQQQTRLAADQPLLVTKQTLRWQYKTFHINEGKGLVTFDFIEQLSRQGILTRARVLLYLCLS